MAIVVCHGLDDLGRPMPPHRTHDHNIYDMILLDPMKLSAWQPKQPSHADKLRHHRAINLRTEAITQWTLVQS